MDITPPEGQAMSPHRHSFATDQLEAYKHWFGGMHFKFPTFKHDHPAIIDVNRVADEQLTPGQRIADKVAATVGSWPFIITQSIILAAWLVLNSVAIIKHWDPYPFILLNLMLSFQAAYAAPFVMMSQNRQAEKDRLTAQNDYVTDCKGEEEIRYIMEHLDHQDDLILQIVKRLEEQHMEMKEQLMRLDPELVKRLATDAQKVVKEQAEQNQG
ncbi:MAG TPA: DUF1003 domain-containing protein [Ktedonobacteraceae bacterium]|nr:DUF1003 domain-containing protein [Ktedonobacteraceae bacterium]